MYIFLISKKNIFNYTKISYGFYFKKLFVNFVNYLFKIARVLPKEKVNSIVFIEFFNINSAKCVTQQSKNTRNTFVDFLIFFSKKKLWLRLHHLQHTQM